jgi:hypothetical protein
MYSDRVFLQEYDVDSTKYRNIIASYGPEDGKRIIVGAHYDTFGEQNGADDNASGVAGLLEYARLLKGRELPIRIDLVAYSLEEPPYFRTESMGSFIHAKSLKDSSVNVALMISLETIGFYSEEENSQTYPDPQMNAVYPNQGNFIAIVSKSSQYEKGQFLVDQINLHSTIKAYHISAPSSVAGIDWSDHMNYWKFEYPGFMITDTAPYRNKNYHKETDTIELLNLDKMAIVLNGILQTILNLK